MTEMMANDRWSLIDKDRWSLPISWMYILIPEGLENRLAICCGLVILIQVR